MLFLWYVEMKGNLSAFPKLLIQISYYLLIQLELIIVFVYLLLKWIKVMIELNYQHIFQTVNV